VPFQVIPKEPVFYDLLEQAAMGVAAGTRELVALVDELPGGGEHDRRIRELEHEGDVLTHRILETLNTTFVTPFDRHDIHRLASSLDDVLDFVEAISDLLVLHRASDAFPGVRQLADVLDRSAQAIVVAVRHLRTLPRIERDRAEISRLEREGDRIYRRAVAALFSGDHQAIEVLKWKDIVDQLEAAVDRCHDIGSTLGSIALKYA
jgi:predicted phosphate transport protein (TIGR00153 family)